MANTHNPEYAQWVLDEIVEDDDFRARYREIDAVFDRFCTEEDIAAAEEAAAYIDGPYRAGHPGPAAPGDAGHLE
jgi:hypothetical protein